MVETAIPHLGDTIGGKYRVERALGRGGMGAVFEVSHCVTQKHFAIKWLMSEPSSSNDAVTRFVREAQVAGRCEHRNIVEVYDIDRFNGQLFMVMELLKGESLAERLMRCSTGLEYRETCRLLVPCIEAVAEAHAAGIIHRDLKPANIFICQARGREPEYAKVLDFGVSRFVTPDSQFEIGAQTRSGAIIGTPFYMSPEQMRGHPIDARADVYSMGVTLYETLTGQRPYQATSYGDLLLKVTGGQLTPVSEIVAGVPRPVSEIVARAMATDPAERFASMRELARVLEPFAGMAIPMTPQLSWSTATHNTPLVSETASSVQDLELFTRSVRSPARLAMWVAFAAIVLGLIAWQTTAGLRKNTVRAGTEASSASTERSAATAVPRPAEPAVADPTVSAAPAAPPGLAAPPRGQTEDLDGTGETATSPAVGPSPEHDAHNAHNAHDAHNAHNTSESPERTPAAPHRKRLHSAQDAPAAATAAEEEVVQPPPRTIPKRNRARAPAHLERDDF